MAVCYRIDKHDRSSLSRWARRLSLRVARQSRIAGSGWRMACSLAEGMHAGLQAEATQGGVRVAVQTAEFGCAQLAGPHQAQEGVCIDLDSQRFARLRIVCRHRCAGGPAADALGVIVVSGRRCIGHVGLLPPSYPAVRSAEFWECPVRGVRNDVSRADCSWAPS
jgi:hypothetical protein